MPISVPSGSQVTPGGQQGIQGVNALQTFGWHLESPTVKSYYLDVSASTPYQILGIYGIMGSGTATIQLLLNGTLVTGSTLSLTTVLASASLAQAVAANAMLQLQVTAA